MSSYKDQLREALTQAGWEIERIDPEGIDWWACEHWHIQSFREEWGYSLVLSFLVDPMELPGRRHPTVWAISVTTQTPTDRISATRGIAVLSMASRHFAPKLQEFIIALAEHRNEQATRNDVTDR